MGIQDKLLRVETDTAFTTAAYSTDEVDFGMAVPDVNARNEFGLHIVVTTLFAGLASGVIMWIVNGAATTPTTLHSGMFIAVAKLVAGAHFFIPCGSIPLLRFARARYAPVSEAASAGKITAWFGPKEGGEG